MFSPALLLTLRGNQILTTNLRHKRQPISLKRKQFKLSFCTNLAFANMFVSYMVILILIIIVTILTIRIIIIKVKINTNIVLIYAHENPSI